MSEPILCQRGQYQCLDCGYEVTQEYLNDLPLYDAIELATARLCLLCQGVRSAERSGEGGDSNA